MGSCNELLERLRRHNAGHSVSTRKGIQWQIVYKKEFASKGDAMKEEYRIKSQKSRQYIERLISGE